MGFILSARTKFDSAVEPRKYYDDVTTINERLALAICFGKKIVKLYIVCSRFGTT